MRACARGGNRIGGSTVGKKDHSVARIERSEHQGEEDEERKRSRRDGPMSIVLNRAGWCGMSRATILGLTIAATVREC